LLSVIDLINSSEAVVFDCADTLLRLDPPRAVIFRDAAAEIGLNLQIDDVERAYELVHFALTMKSSELTSAKKKEEFYRGFNESLCAALGIARSVELLHPIVLNRFASRRRWVAFEDAAFTLREIGNHVPVHALANWDRRLDDVLKGASLRHLLGDVASSEMLGAEKPARACFDAFLMRNSLQPHRVTYVGNEYIADVLGARAAGLTPVLVDRYNKLPTADCTRILTLSELVSGQ
jgi:putative hydrolase of the HAD superfamily